MKWQVMQNDNSSANYGTCDPAGAFQMAAVPDELSRRG